MSAFFSAALLLWLPSAPAAETKPPTGWELVKPDKKDPDISTGGAFFLDQQPPEKAREAMEELVRKLPRCTSCLYNLGLFESRAGKPGAALGYWRRAVALDPSYQTARRAIDWEFKKLDRQDIAHENDEWESFRGVALAPVGVWTYGWLALALFFGAGWSAISWQAARARAAAQDEAAPPPTPAVLASIALFAIAAGLQAAKLVDASTARATIVAKKIEARSAPDSGSAPLFDLFEGLEVVVRQSLPGTGSSGGWAQVAYPGGGAGWVPASTIYITDGRR